MAAANLEVFKGGTFIFEVGGAEFIVYKKLIARTSDALLAHIETKMKESQTGRVPLKETDEHTFGRFVEFLYTGDYNPAEPVKLASAESSAQKEPGAACQVVDFSQSNEVLAAATVRTSESYLYLPISGYKQKKQWGKNKKFHARDEDDEDDETQPPRLPRVHSEIHIRRSLATNSKISGPLNAKLDYMPLFMSHAQLYAFAEKFNITDLRELTAGRLHEALAGFRPSQNPETKMSRLVKCVFDNTPWREREVDKLRTVVARFCAVHIGALQTSTEFLTLLHAEGQLSEVLMREVCEIHRLS